MINKSKTSYFTIDKHSTITSNTFWGGLGVKIFFFGKKKKCNRHLKSLNCILRKHFGKGVQLLPTLATISDKQFKIPFKAKTG